MAGPVIIKYPLQIKPASMELVYLGVIIFTDKPSGDNRLAVFPRFTGNYRYALYLLCFRFGLNQVIMNC